MWQGGLFPKILRDSSFLADAVKTYLGNYNKEKQKGKQELPSILLRWIILDGVLHPSWTEGLNTVVDCEKKLSMANCGQVPLSSKNILFHSFSSYSLSNNKTYCYMHSAYLIFKFCIFIFCVFDTCSQSCMLIIMTQNLFSVDSSQLMFETTDLTNASPSVVTHCSLIHFGDETVQWQSLFECWAKTAKSKWIFTSSW